MTIKKLNLDTVPPSSKNNQTFLGRGALRLAPQNFILKPNKYGTIT